MGLVLIYGACFGIELTINNIAAIYYHDFFDLNLKTAGLIAGLFGLMNLFARSLGGFFGDKAGIKWGLRGRVAFLGIVLLIEGNSLSSFFSNDNFAVGYRIHGSIQPFCTNGRRSNLFCGTFH